MLLRIQDLKVDGVGADGRITPICKGISIDLARGEVLGLIGESGAGKSTLGLAALGYTRHGCRFTGGRVLLDGEDVLRFGHAQLVSLRGRRVAYVAQSAAASFNPAHRLMDQITEVAVRHEVASRAEAERRAVAYFERLGLPDPARFGQRYPHQVSGGQLQRAMTVMAMIGKPDIVVFDEPTTALDVTTQIEVLVAIRDVVRAEQTAAFYISHDLAVVAQVADRIAVLRYGELVEEGPTAQVLSEPARDYTRRLVNVRHVDAGGRDEIGQDGLLAVTNVAAAYGMHRVLEGISVAVSPGETVAVVGESGSGKSTLARVVTGLLPPDQGQIRFKGAVLPPRLVDRTKDQLRRIQMIYQMPDVALNPRQTVGAILARVRAFYFGASASEQALAVAELLQLTELAPEIAERLPGELSGGQKQRVCIARALAAEPDLVICDEVTSALDPLVADEILKLLLRLQRETRVAYLFITHDLATVRAIAHRVVVMQSGRIVEEAPKERLFTDPREAYTKKLLASVPAMRTGWLDEVLEGRAA